MVAVPVPLPTVPDPESVPPSLIYDYHYRHTYVWHVHLYRLRWFKPPYPLERTTQQSLDTGGLETSSLTGLLTHGVGYRHRQ